ncbi:hypothetical protein [Streptomyces luteoverticillatus]|uniref:hypothetical protein n=1 Tax=Streptomyces luteoverticillatus TaxID=66425 RepID=UPI0013DF6DF1|nr:hypothetical protein [Streptomyces luteoverticillatus]
MIGETGVDSAPETLLRRLARARGIEPYAAFRPKYERAARELSTQDNDPEIRQATLSQRQYARWLAGDVKEAPYPVACRILRHMFNRSASELLALAPPTEPSPQIICTAPAPPTITEDELLMSAHDAASHAGDAASQALSPATLDLLRNEVFTLAQRYHLKRPDDVFRAARAVREKVERHMPLTHRPDQETALYVIAGQACALMASAAFDLGSQEAARTLTYAALGYARPIDHHPLMAWSSGNLGLLAYWGNRPAEAVGHVRAAQEIATSGTGQARLHSIAARAYAYLGDARSVERELHEAEEVNRDLRDELHDDVGGEFSFPPERAAMSAGTSWVLLGDGRHAVAASTKAITLLQGMPAHQRSTKVGAEAAADLALAQLLNQDLEAATSALEAVFNLDPEQRVDGLMLRMAGVRSQLLSAPFRQARIATELGERIEEFSLNSARLLLLPPAPRALT